jgi:hypothetical protein
MNLQDYFSSNIEDRRDEDFRPDPLHRLLPPTANPQQVLEHQSVLDRPNPYVEMFMPRGSQPVFGLTPPRPFLPENPGGMPRLFGDQTPQQQFGQQQFSGYGMPRFNLGPVDSWGRMPRTGSGRSIADILGN